MCEQCVRKGKRSKKRYGEIKALAHRLEEGYGIPIFENIEDNLAVEGHLYKMQRAKTQERYKRKGRRVRKEYDQEE